MTAAKGLRRARCKRGGGDQDARKECKWAGKSIGTVWWGCVVTVHDVAGGRRGVGRSSEPPTPRRWRDDGASKGRRREQGTSDRENGRRRRRTLAADGGGIAAADSVTRVIAYRRVPAGIARYRQRTCACVRLLVPTAPQSAPDASR